MASPFLNANVVTQQGNALSHYNYEELSRNKGEFLNSSLWDYDWTKSCNAVYFPGNLFTKMRLTSFNPSFPSDIQELMVRLRNGYELHQKVWGGTTAGTFQCTYQDFEDQGIHAWLWDWREKYGDMNNRVAFRTEDTTAEGEAKMFNSSRIPIRKYTMYSIQLSDAGLSGLFSPAFTSDDPSNLG